MSRTFLTGSALAVSALVAALAWPSAATASTPSRPAATTHKIAFTAKHTGLVPTSRRSYVLTDEVIAAGRQIGADVLSCRTSGELARCLATLALGDGQLHLRLTLAEDGDLRGKVIGGEGRYAGATGRARGHAMSEAKERVVLHWRS